MKDELGGYGSHVEFMLKGMPEAIQFFPGRGNIAVNVHSSEGMYYWVAIGERVGSEFLRVVESQPLPLQKGSDIGALADFELSHFGEKSKIFDVFLEGKLFREAERQ